MRKIIVHENFTESANDIALLQLGKKGLSGDPLYSVSLKTDLQTIEWIYQSSALPVFPTTVQALLVRKGTSMVGSTSCYNKVSPSLCIRLGRHWTSDLHRHAARGSGSHCPDQQLYRENEPGRGCGRKPDCVCRGCCERTMQGGSPNQNVISFTVL